MQQQIDRLRRNITEVFLGNQPAVDRLICCLLARGHALIEDVPGVGKTVLASSIAKSVDCPFTRIQLTPDMLPADVLGVTIYDRESGRFEFKRGPIFTSILLADEINRATPRTQTALLEAMNEASVSIDGMVHQLGPPFMVLATQNPYEFEGTYLLPENQLDRFLMRIRLGYPPASEEARLLELRPAQNRLATLEPVLHADDVIALQDAVDAVRLDESLRNYIVEIAHATREHPEVQVGLSPRGALALAQAARAAAVMDGRDYVVPDDIVDLVIPVCAHRVISRAYSSGGGGEAIIEILESVIQSLASPA
ncbi:MAG: AAA family ATPase [Phycisphaerales bacterium]